MAVDYPLRAAYSSFVTSPVPGSFNTTVVADGTTCVGTTSLVHSMSYDGSLRGVASVNTPQTFWISLQTCGGAAVNSPYAIDLTQILHRDATGAILGLSDSEVVSVARAPIVLPKRIREGDSATLGTLDNFEPAGGASVGTTVVSYAAKRDGTSSETVLVELTYVSTGTGREFVQRDLITYRLGASGPLRLMRHEMSSPEGSLSLVDPT